MLLRKVFSTIRFLFFTINTVILKLKLKFFIEKITFKKCLKAHSNVYVAATDNGSITFGKNVVIHRSVKIIAQSGHIVIGDNVHVGEGCIIVAKNNITIGNDVLIAEYVVIRDQNHNINSIPYRSSGYVTGPISISDNVWLGAKSTVLNGVFIGENTVIGAHALVNKSICSNVLAAGVPAKVMKTI